MVDREGLEPSVFLVSLIYSQLPSPLGHLSIKESLESRGYPLGRWLKEEPKIKKGGGGTS